MNLAIIRKFIPYLYPYIGKEIIIFGLMLIAGAGSLATPYFLKIIIDDIFPSGSYSQLVTLLVWLVIIYIIRIGCAVGTDIMYTRVSTHIVSDIRRDMLTNILGRPLQFFRSARSGEVLYTVMNDVENIQQALSSLLLHFLNNCITVLGILVMLGILNLKLTLISLLIVPFLLYSIRRFTPRLQKSFRHIQELQEKLSELFLETIRNIRIIRSYDTVSYEQQRLLQLQKLLRKGYSRNTLLASSNSNITTFFVAIGPVIVLIYGGYGVFNGAMTIGSLIAFIQYLNRLYAPTISIMENYNQLNNSLVSMERVAKYIETRPRHPAKEAAPVLPAFQKLSLVNVGLQIDNKPILQQINMEFERGKIYGLIGPSGSGKSSIANLICGFWQPSSGKIVLDGHTPVNEVKAWSAALGLIEKENQLFSDTILSNIRYGSFEKDDAAVQKAAEHACFAEIADHLPQQYNTTVNETGTLLSDGQKQRISISRALLKQAPVLIFDEATASLDQQLEQQLLQHIRQYYAHSIVIVITHRLGSLGNFDYVYALQQGELVNQGTPAAFYPSLTI